MNNVPQYFILGDPSWPVEALAEVLPRRSDVSVWIEGQGWLRDSGLKNSRQTDKKDAIAAAQDCCDLAQSRSIKKAVVILGFRDSETSKKVVDEIRSAPNASKIRVLEVGAQVRGRGAKKTGRKVAWSDLVSQGMDTEIQLLTHQEQVRALMAHIEDAERIGILLQDDPDPDGLASSLALRKLLHRNARTVQICTFGRITRPENVAMVDLLEIELVHLTETSDLSERFDCVVCLDCQPSFFKGRDIQPSAIIDHHPKSQSTIEFEKDPSVFVDVTESIGSISSLLTQYLRTLDIEVSQRLATALLYGIKSDTLLFNRQASDQDLESFMYLYPRISAQTLRRIERPALPALYLQRLQEGLKNIVHKNGLCVLGLGTIAREEWVPMGADFAAQIEGAEWALCWGFFEGKLVISVRHLDQVLHCGDFTRNAFAELGCAGGHRSMAKAMLDWKLVRKKIKARGSSVATISSALHSYSKRELTKIESAQSGS
jgi:nanoRNase/pAp phosphatase (c-di-AMP/oligoRNAs hydrolase)